MRPRPTPSATTEPFWAATAEQRFLVQHCASCGHVQHYPRPTCTACGATELTWQPISGRGTVHTYTVARRPTHKAFDGAEPAIIAIVELAEGPRLTTNIVDCDPDAVHVDMAVELCWDEPGPDGIRLPLFRPA